MPRTIFVRHHAEATERIDWAAAAYAGLIGGAVFMALQMTMVWLFLGGSPWGPPRMIAAMVLGRGVLPPPAGFDFGIVITGMIVHFILAVIFGFIMAALVRNTAAGAAIFIGLAIGLAIYLIDFYPLSAAFFPWFASARNWVTVVNHVIFGGVLAWSYVGLARHQTQT